MITEVSLLFNISYLNEKTKLCQFFFLVTCSFLCVLKTPRDYCFLGEQKQ